MSKLNFQDSFNNSSKLRFERYESKDLGEIIRFQKQAYIDQFNAADYAEEAVIKEHFTWKYLENPNNLTDRPFIWFARFADEIIAQFCIMPTRLKIGDNFYNAGWGQDLIVSPEFRNRGIGYFLIKHALNEVDGCLDLLFIGGTNKTSHLLFEALGFTDIVVLPRYIKILKFLKNVYGRRDNSIDDGLKLDFDKIWNRLKDEKKCIFKRDERNIRWRFIKQSRYEYRIFTVTKGAQVDGYTILRKGNIQHGSFKNLKLGIISDIFYQINDKKTFNLLLTKAIEYFRVEGINLIRFDILAPQLDFMLLRRGFIRISSRNKFLFFIINKDLKSKENEISLKDNWFLTFFDSDFDLL